MVKKFRPYATELGQRIYDKLEGSGLTSFWDALKFEELDADAMAALGHAPRGGLYIPYFDLDGHAVPFYRVRYLEDPPINGFKIKPSKIQRYAQAPGTINDIYLPPIVPWRALAEDPEAVLVITEGELKAACACRHDIPCLGLGGVFNFRAAKAGLDVLPRLREIKWQGRKVIVCFDSDAASNPMVQAAESMLCRVLGRLGAVPHILRLPSLDEGQKTGLDDWLQEQAEPADAFFELCQSAQPPDPLISALHALNERYVVVEDPPCIYDPLDHRPIKYGDFVNLIVTGKVVERVEGPKGVKLVEHPLAKRWLEWDGRSKVRKLVYEPGAAPIVDGQLNLWQGWGVEPHKGDVKPFLELLAYAVPDDDARKWLLQWLAYPVQHPGAKLYSSVILWGTEQGTGKSLLGKIMTMLYGEHGVSIDEERLKGRFNSWQKNVSFCVGEETTGSDSRALANKLKDMVTRSEVWVEHKGVDAMRLTDHVNYLFLSNHADAFKLDVTDRRYFVWEMPSHKAERGFYKAIDRWKDSPEGLPALLDYLLHVDLSEFDPLGPAPVTAAKLAMVSINQSDHAAWLEAWLLNPTYELVTSEELVNLYEPDSSRRKVRANGMARALRELRVNLVNNKMGVLLSDKTQPRIYAVARKPERRAQLEGMRSTELRAVYEAERKRSKVR